MIGNLVAAVLAIVAPAPETLLASAETAQAQPYTPAPPRVLNEGDAVLFREGLAAARARDVTKTRDVMGRIQDPVARTVVEWALIDTSADRLSFIELAGADARLRGWPRSDSRIAATERALDQSGMGADAALAFFEGRAPTTVEGVIALASAYEQNGRVPEARALVSGWWRNQSFSAEAQTRILTRWGGWLTQADHEARLNMLLLGPHGPATRAMVALVSPERRAVAEAAMALRTAYAPDAVLVGLTPAQAMDPVVVFERVRIARARGRQSEAFGLLSALPPAPSHKEGQDALWSERRNYFLDALTARNWQAAYDAMAGHGFPSGDRKVDAEFFAGWVALTRLNDPVRAAGHFETLRQVSSTPITQGRANYWLGRTAEAQGKADEAREWYAAGARHIQTFYGQLAAERLGMTFITLPADPEITQGDRARFEGDTRVKALRILGDAGEMSLLRVFAYEIDNDLPDATGLAQLMDLTRAYGEEFTAMMVGRAASQRGFLMPERQYPIRIPPQVAGAAPLEFTLAITRQESSFDPRARSHADARGMMQFLPATAQGVARRLGMPYSPDRLWDPDYNMTLGSYHLAELTGNFGGSMLLATVGYNAGPARPPQWVARCGDPRGGQVDPVDFIECAPFTETRNYMMRVMENMTVYRARLNGGTGPLLISTDLARGASPGPRPYLDVVGSETDSSGAASGAIDQ